MLLGKLCCFLTALVKIFIQICISKKLDCISLIKKAINNTIIQWEMLLKRFIERKHSIRWNFVFYYWLLFLNKLSVFISTYILWMYSFLLLHELTVVEIMFENKMIIRSNVNTFCIFLSKLFAYTVMLSMDNTVLFSVLSIS